MKFSTMTFMAVASLAAMAVAAGCGDASPAVTVNCADSVTLVIPVGQTGLVVQVVEFTDPATTGSASPLSLSNARIISPIPSAVTVCAGNCGTGGTFGSDVKVQTDVSGLLEYTVKISQAGVANADLLEIFGSQSPATCKVAVSGS